MSGEEDFSFNLEALSDYDIPELRSPQSVGVGGRLDTPPGPRSPSILPQGPTIGVGTSTNPVPSNVTVGVGSSLPTVAYKTPLARPTTGGKQPRRVPRQNTPSSPSDPGSRGRSSASGSSSGGSGDGQVVGLVQCVSCTGNV